MFYFEILTIKMLQFYINKLIEQVLYWLHSS